MKDEILNFMYELIEKIKDRNDRLIADWGNEQDGVLNEKQYKERRNKARELVAKIK